MNKLSYILVAAIMLTFSGFSAPKSAKANSYVHLISGYYYGGHRNYRGNYRYRKYYGYNRGYRNYGHRRHYGYRNYGHRRYYGYRNYGYRNYGYRNYYRNYNRNSYGGYK